jgi:hypothetical protein
VPLLFSNEAILASIGNQIGKFVGSDPSWESKYDRRWAWIQIEVDIRNGLLDEINWFTVVSLGFKG